MGYLSAWRHQALSFCELTVKDDDRFILCCHIDKTALYPLSHRLNGQPFQIISGTIHYFRIHPAQWRMRLLQLYEAGLNTVETYIPCVFKDLSCRPEMGLMGRP